MIKLPVPTAKMPSTATASPPANPDHAEFLASQDEIECPLTGEIVAIDDADGLIDMFERLNDHNKIVYARLVRLRETLGQLTEGDAKTRRVIGERRKAKLVFPDNSFDQSILKEVWNSYPELSQEYLRLERLAVRGREYKKLGNSSGPDSFNMFRDILTSAEREATAPPTVSIEK